MSSIVRIRGLLFDPRAEWARIESENRSIFDLYLRHVALLAAFPPFASFAGGWLYGVRRAHVIVHPDLAAGLLRAVVQYVLTFPALFIAAFVISMAAPFFDGRSDDRRAFTLVVYSWTPSWLASLFGLVPYARWLDLLGLYGLWIFYLGMPQMTKCPKEHADVFTLAALFVAVGVGALHAGLVRWIAPGAWL